MHPLKPTLIGGHRGNGETDSIALSTDEYFEKSPENTIASVMEAMHQNVGLIEVDVVLSRDGVPMVIHSNDLRQHVFHSKFDSKKYFVSDYDANTLFTMQVGRQNQHRVNAHMPRLSEIIDLIAKANRTKTPPIILNIELKDTQGTSDNRSTQPISLVEAVSKAIDISEINPQHLLLSSFSTTSLAEARDRLPYIKRGLLCVPETADDMGKALFPAEPSDVSVYQAFTPSTVERWHAELGICAVHPEITSLLPRHAGNIYDDIAQAALERLARLKSPQAQPLMLVAWHLNEKITPQHEYVTHQVFYQAEKLGLEAAIITNFIAQTQKHQQTYQQLKSISSFANRQFPPNNQ